MLTRERRADFRFIVLTRDKCKYKKKKSLEMVRQTSTASDNSRSGHWRCGQVRRRGRGFSAAMPGGGSPEEGAQALLQRTVQDRASAAGIALGSLGFRHLGGWGRGASLRGQTSVCCCESSGGTVTSSKGPSSPLS